LAGDELAVPRGGGGRRGLLTRGERRKKRQEKESNGKATSPKVLPVMVENHGKVGGTFCNIKKVKRTYSTQKRKERN